MYINELDFTKFMVVADYQPVYLPRDTEKPLSISNFKVNRELMDEVLYDNRGIFKVEDGEQGLLIYVDEEFKLITNLIKQSTSLTVDEIIKKILEL